MRASYIYSSNCGYHMNLYGFMGSCDMLPLPPITRRRQCGMPNPALTQVWAYVGPCLVPGQGPGPGPARMDLRMTAAKKLKRRSAKGSPCLVLRLIMHGLGSLSIRNKLSVRMSEITPWRCSGTPAAERAEGALSAAQRSAKHSLGRFRRFIRYKMDSSESSRSTIKEWSTLSKAAITSTKNVAIHFFLNLDRSRVALRRCEAKSQPRWEMPPHIIWRAESCR